MSLFLRSGNSPAIILRPSPVLTRRHRLHRLIHPRTRGHDVVAQARQYDAENRRVLHAVPTTPHATLDDLVEEVHRVETDDVVRRIVQVEILPRHVGKEVLLQDRCEGEAFGRVGGILILEDGGAAIFGGEGQCGRGIRRLVPGCRFGDRSGLCGPFWNVVAEGGVGVYV